MPFPLSWKGTRQRGWLDISMCAKAANPSCFPEFDEWQRRVNRYDPTAIRSTGRLAKTRAKGRISACSPMPKMAMSGGGGGEAEM